MKAIILGAGMMGRAAAYDLVRNPAVEKIKIVDAKLETANEVKEWLNSPKVEVGKFDAALSLFGYPILQNLACI